jgi:hypothetical protein
MIRPAIARGKTTMTTRAGAQKPFLLNFLPTFDRSRIEGAKANKDLMIGSYDPVTQTSVRSVLSGTVLTYSDTWFGSDTAQSDT